MSTQTALRLMFQCGRKLNQITAKTGGDATMLIMLSKDGVCTQRQLIEATGKRSATLSEQLQNMESAGLITRSRNQQDKRNVDVRLTEKGREAASRALPYSEHLANALFADMKDRDLQKMTGYLESVLHKAEAYRPE